MNNIIIYLFLQSIEGFVDQTQAQMNCFKQRYSHHVIVLIIRLAGGL